MVARAQRNDDDWERKDGCEVVRWDSSLEGFKGALQHRSVIYTE